MSRRSPRSARLAREHDATLIVDDAHATGILGEGGRGLSGEADIVIGTFSKALGGFGAYVACSGHVARLSDQSLQRADLLDRAAAAGARRHRCGARSPARRSTPSAPMSRGSPRGSGAARERVGFDTGASTTQIVPLIAGTAEAALALSEQAARRGLLGDRDQAADRAAGTARVRLAFTAAHDEADVDRLLDVLEEKAGQQRREGLSSRAMHFVLVHGWGFHAGIWADVVAHLGRSRSHARRSRIRVRRAQGHGRMARRQHRCRPFAWAALAAPAGRRTLQGTGQHPGLRLLLLPCRRHRASPPCSGGLSATRATRFRPSGAPAAPRLRPAGGAERRAPRRGARLADALGRAGHASDSSTAPCSPLPPATTPSCRQP